MMQNAVDARCGHSRCENKPHYVVMGRCTNCAWTGHVWITNGHEKIDMRHRAECPRCKCRSLSPGEFVMGNGHVA